MNDGPANLQGDDELLEGVVQHFTSELRAGRQPSIDAFQKLHPRLADEIHELLSSVAMIESLKKDDLSHSPTPLKNTRALQIDRLGDYRIIEEIGRGGMGVVLLGVHESLGRRVAIKVMPAHLAANEKYCERFRREAQAAATLHHTNIVGVFGVGRSDGHHYYVMEYVDGCGLNVVIRGLRTSAHSATLTPVAPAETRMSGRPAAARLTRADDEQTRISMNDDTDVLARSELPFDLDRIPPIPAGQLRFRWAAELGAQIADAIQYAHDQGKMHRDIKPANLILDREGRVWLTDFGLVKTFSDDSMTGLGEIIGTPQYMAPEAFSGTYDRRSEVYCLGLTLYELIALQPAFASSSTTAMLRQVTSETIVPLRKIDPAISRDLATIVEKATDRESSRRYETAGQLRDDLRAWMAGRPISARRAAIPHRLWLWSKRNPWAALSAALTVLVAITATAGYFLVSSAYNALTVQHQQLVDQQKQTRAAQGEAEKNATRFRDQYLRAEANIEMTLQMFDEMFKRMVVRGTGDDRDFSFDGFQELVGVETTVTAADAGFLEDMLVFFQHFAEANVENTELRSESARAFRRVANIYHLTGKFNDAVEAYQKSLALYESLVGQGDNTSDWMPVKARTANEMALALSRSGKYREAMDQLRNTLQVLRTGPRSDEAVIQFEIARTLNLIGSLLPLEPQETTPEALIEILPPSIQQRVRQRQRLIDRRLTTPVELVRNQKSIRQAIEILDALIGSQGREPQYVAERAKSHARLAELLFHSNDMPASDDARSSAIVDLEWLVATYPTEIEYQALFAQVIVLPVSATYPDRATELERATQLTDSLQEQRPRNLDFAQLDAECNYQLGQVYFESNSIDVAIDAWQRCLESLSRVVNNSPENGKVQIRLAATTLELAEMMVANQRYDRARDMLRSSTVVMQRQLRSQRNGQAGRLIISRLYELLAKSLTELGDERGAKTALRQATQVRQRPDSPDSRQGSANRPGPGK